MSILVTTPTGNIGSRILENLLATGHDVALLARDPARLPAAVRERAAIHQGELEDPAALRRALAGAGAAFLLIPPFWAVPDWRAWQRQVGRTFVAALRDAGVSRAVFLSSVGAHRPDLSAVSGLGEVEAMLRDAIPDVASLRAGYFFENHLAAIPTIAAEGHMYGALSPELAPAQVATRDIGDVAARWLADATWTGHLVAGVHGPRDLSFAEVAAALGAALGRPVTYVQVPVAAVGRALAAAGMGRSMVAGYEEMLAGFEASRFERAEPRTPATTTATTFESFARDVVRPAYEAYLRRDRATTDAAA